MSNLQIREVGSYEVVFFDTAYKRIKELVSPTSLTETQQIAEAVKQECNADSYTISKVLINTKFNKWAPYNNKGN